MSLLVVVYALHTIEAVKGQLHSYRHVYVTRAGWDSGLVEE